MKTTYLKTVLGLTAALSLAAAPALAQQPLEVSYPGDASMDCTAIAAEVARMDGVIADANAQVNKADGSARGAGMASTVAVEGMLRTGVLGRMPGLGQFANAASNMARQNAEKVRANAGQTIQTATTRKAMMSGLYAGKSCNAQPQAEAAAPAAG